MKKRLLFIIAGIIVIALCAIVIWSLIQSHQMKAQLVVDSGTVQVKHINGVWISAENGMVLYQNDAIKTGDNTSASIILFESSIIRLDSNTEVTLKEVLHQVEGTKVMIQQDEGRTWNTISKISGIDNYEVQTPVAVASVRGTSFSVQVFTNGKTIVGVGTGTVNVSRIKISQIKSYIEVNTDEAVTIDPDTPEKPFEITPFEKDEWILQNQLQDNELWENNKAELYQRIEPYIPELKQKYGVNDQELGVLIDGYLRGDFALPPETPDWIRQIIELS
jgi:hypothetical protein